MWTPCDELIDGKSYCPYAETYTGYEDEMCRNCCGLGVDEDSYPDDYDDYYDDYDDDYAETAEQYFENLFNAMEDER